MKRQHLLISLLIILVVAIVYVHKARILDFYVGISNQSPKEITHVFTGRIVKKIDSNWQGDQYEVEVTKGSGLTTVGSVSKYVIVNNLNKDLELYPDTSLEYNLKTHFNKNRKWYEIIEFSSFILD